MKRCFGLTANEVWVLSCHVFNRHADPRELNATHKRFGACQCPRGGYESIGEIIHGKRAITPDTALRLARFFGNSAEFWLNLQQMHDLSKARIELGKTIDRDVDIYAAI